MNINQVMLGDEIEFDAVYESQGAQDEYIVQYHGVVIWLKKDRNGSLCQGWNPLDIRFTVVDNFRLIHRVDQARGLPPKSRSNPTPGGQ